MNKWVKRFLYFLGGLVTLILLVFLFLQTNWAKRIIRNKVAAYVSGKTGTEFRIGSIDYSLPKWVELKGVFMQDRNKDTLLYGNKIRADVAMLKLISGQIEVKKIALDDIFINLRQSQTDSVFNYQFVIDAFAGKPDTTASQDTSAIDLSLEELALKKVRFNLLDDRSGNYTRMSVQDFDLKLKEININTMEFDVDKLRANGLRLELLVNKPLVDTVDIVSAEAAPLPIIKADSIILHDSYVSFIDEVNKMRSINDIADLQVHMFSNAGNLNTFRGDYVGLFNSNILFEHVLQATGDTASAKVSMNGKDTVMVNDMAFIINEINLRNNNITYNNNALPVKINGLDYAHLAISELQLIASNNSFQNGRIETTIKAFSFKDKSGFQLDTLQGAIRIDSRNIFIQNLLAKTPGSVIKADANVYPASFMPGASQNESDIPENHLLLTNTIISKKDLDLLADGMTAEYEKQLDVLGNLLINTNITGNSRQLFISNLSVRTLNSNAFSTTISGTASNVADPKRLSYNLNIRQLNAVKALIEPFLAESPQPVNLPPSFAINGTVAGTMNRVQTNLHLNSAFGKLNAKTNLVNFQNPGNMQYDIVLTTADLETGKWIYQDSLLGKLTGTVTAKGFNGFDITKNNLKTTADISAFRFQKNVINNIKLNALLIKGIADFTASVNDELLQVNMDGNADLQSEYPKGSAIINLQKADVYALGYAADSMRLSTRAELDINNSSPQALDAMVRLDSVKAHVAGTNIFSDSLLLTAYRRNDSTLADLTSDLANVNLATNLTYDNAGLLLQEVSGYYIKKPGTPAAPKAAAGAVSVAFVMKPNDLYSSLVPGFSFTNAAGNVQINNSSADSVVKGSITADEIAVGTNRVSAINVKLGGTRDSLLLVATADTVNAANLLLYDALVQAGFADNNLSAFVSSKDKNKRDQYAVGVTAAQNSDNGYNIKLAENLKLNYDDWRVNPQNVIRTSATGFNVQDFAISYNNQSISASSTSGEYNAPVKLHINDFKLGTITAALNQDSMLVEGVLNADITAGKFDQAIPEANGTLTLDSIRFQQTPVGNLNLTASSQASNVRLNGKLDGYGNNVTLAGTYNAQSIDVNIHLEPLNLKSVEPFTMGSLERSSGTITGPIHISGSVNDPDWNGRLSFNDVKTTAAAFGTYLSIQNQTIVLDKPTATFNNFTVTDSTNHPLTINGTISQDANNEFITNLDVKATDFHVINNTSSDNSTLYGKAIIAMDADISGPLTAPTVGGSVVVKDGTDVTYVKQTIPASVKERDAVIEFVDMDTIANLVKYRRPVDETEMLATKSNFEYNLNLEIEPQAKFSVIIDPATRDEVQVQGSADLNIGSAPNGNVNIAGIYTLEAGSYQLNYGLLKRQFNLQKGSTIQLSGDPMNATADITAIYDISVSPIDLIRNEIGSATAEKSNIYKRKVPFEVLLHITGKASKPRLDFDIRVQENAEGVSYEMTNTIDNKLQQLRNDQSSMNKQVFALLTFNRFIGDESSNFFAGTESNSSLLFNESVSSFLNAAVDQLAADLIKGVDLDIDLKSVDDDPAAQRTDLNVALGKSFLNDRLNISVGKNFTVEGSDPSAKTNAASGNNQYLPDFNATYKISKDGRYMLRAYRRNQYEAVMDGYFIETGVTFSFSMSYDKFKELFRRSRKK